MPSVRTRTEQRERLVCLLGMPIDALSMDEVVGLCRRAVSTRDQLRIGVANAFKLVAARKDADLRESLLDCNLIVADGQSLIWARHILRRPLVERVTGNGQKATHLANFGQIVAYLKQTARDGDVIVTMGAGNVWEISRDLVT